MSDSKAQLARLEQQLIRERTARKKAEDMLRVKTRELHAASEFGDFMTERLDLAIASAGEVVWEYAIAENNFYQYDGFKDGRGRIDLAASYTDVVNSYHFDDQKLADKLWQQLMNDEVSTIEFIARRYIPAHKMFRWNLVRGKKLHDKKTGKAVSVIGMFRDVHEQQLEHIAYRTIKGTFDASQVPGFICDFANQFIMVSDSLCLLLGIEKESLTQKQLHTLLPVEKIKQYQSADELSFVATLNTPKGEQSFLFKYSPLVQAPLNDGSLQYAVGFILPQK
ncbi:hypothetical protein ACFO4O_13695 [Glaciecola siphonariae]|uniref:PAS domain-containing protein n=1 Tax=Glaciecola siphonariae TaxID=521012 RepID=A0ABV9LZ91_9ALTE